MSTSKSLPQNTLQFHPLAVKYGGNLSTDEIEALAKDIKDNGQRFPIIVHEGKIIDGIQRYRACLRIKKGPWTVPYDVEKYGGTEADIKAFIISANVHRRHDPKRRRAIIAELLKENPTKSDRAIAKEANVDKNTVAKVRGEKERRGEIHHVDKRTDSKGRKQPASKPKGGGRASKSTITTTTTKSEPVSVPTSAPQKDISLPVLTGAQLATKLGHEQGQEIHALRTKVIALESQIKDQNWWEQEPKDIAAQMVKYFTSTQLGELYAMAVDLRNATQAPKPQAQGAGMRLQRRNNSTVAAH